MWDSVTGKELFTLKGHPVAVSSVAFSPDGRRVVSACWIVKIWNSATGKELLSLNGNHRGVSLDSTSVAFSPDGQRLASGDRDHSIHLWETSVSPEVQDRRAAKHLVVNLFRQLGRRAPVLEWLQAVPGMSPSRRQEALAVALTYPENP
jgi:WD40 repeat protein